MKTKILSIFLAILVTAISCKENKLAELNKFRKEHDELSEKIKKLEDELAKQDTSVQAGLRVAVTEIKPTEFNHFIEVQGKVDGDQNVNVFTEGAGGMIEQILVNEGQSVVKGQILARIDDNILQQNLKSVQTNLDFVTAMYNKQKALWDQKIGSEAQYLDIKSKKESLESSIAALKEQMGMCYIKSPVTGTIEDIPIKVGQLAIPGYILFRVINLATSLKIVADIAEAYTPRVNNGDKVTIFIPDIKKEVEGKVDFNSKYINPTNRTFQIIVRLENFDKNLKANMIAILKINDYKAPNSIVVPLNVVQNDLTGNYVMIAEKTNKGSIAKKAYVITGETYKGLTEIKSGLKTNDLFISAGFLNLEKGQAVNY